MAKNRNKPQNQRQIEEFFTDNYFMGMPMVHTTDGFLVPWDKTPDSGHASQGDNTS